MKLGLIFSINISVADWDKLGLLDREKGIYQKYLKDGKIDKVYWFTYGDAGGDHKWKLPDGIEVISMPALFNSKLGAFAYSFLMPFLKNRYFKDCDVLKTNQMRGAWAGLIAKLLSGRPLILRTGYTWSLDIERRFGKSIVSFFVSRIEWVLCKSSNLIEVATDAERDYISKKYSLRKDKISVIPNCVDTEIFKPLGVKKEQGSIIFVGRLSREKNLENLIAAIAKTPYRLDVYGDGPSKGKLLELSGRLGARVEFKGVVKNAMLPEILNRYKLYILPSFYENMPKALLEAMSCGLACIGSDVPGIRNLIKDGHSGALCKTDADDIRKTINEIAQDNVKIDFFGRNAREFVAQNYSLDKIAAKEFAECIRKVI